MNKQKGKKARYIKGLYLSLIGLLLISLSSSCNMPGADTGGVDVNIDTAVAQTMTAKALETQQAVGGEGQGEEDTSGGDTEQIGRASCRERVCVGV